MDKSSFKTALLQTFTDRVWKNNIDLLMVASTIK
jgi:hypothetical protein